MLFSFLLQYISSWLQSRSSVVVFGSFGSFVLFSMLIVKILRILVWNVQIVNRWNTCFGRVLHFWIFVRNGWSKLTPLYLEKHVSTIKLKLSFLEWETQCQSISRTKDYEDLEHTSTKVWENCWGLRSSSINGGTASVTETAGASENTEMLIILRPD